MVYSAAASHYVRPARFYSVVTSHHMEGTMEHSGPMLKFGRVDSSSQTCMEMPKSSCGDAQDVRKHGDINSRDAMPLKSNLPYVRAV
jgi:hypothetical protein